MKKTLLKFGLLVFLVVLVASAGWGKIPQGISFSGRLTEDGQLVEGTKTIKFSIYSAVEGGDRLWTEIHNNVNVTKGVFSVILGLEGSPIPTDIFDDPTVYLDIDVDNNGTSMTPRQMLVSVPFAFHALEAERATAAGGWQTDSSTKTVTNYKVGIGTPDPMATLTLNSPITNLGVGVPALEVGNPGGNAGVFVGSDLDSFLGMDWFEGKARIYTSANDTLLLQPASGGYVGIGTDAPGRILDVNGKITLRPGNSSYAGIWLTDTNGADEWFVGKTNIADKNQFGLYKGGWRMVVEDSGNVGIGTTSPNSDLEVARAEGGSLSVYRDDADAYIANGNQIGEIVFAGNDGQAGVVGAKIRAEAKGFWSGTADQPTELQFYTAPDGGTVQQRMVIDKDGNVGIGKTAPGLLLDVESSGGAIRGKSLGMGSGLNGESASYWGIIGDGHSAGYGGILGRSNNGTGVYGSTQTGFGAKAIATNNTGVALYANNAANGTALEIARGNIKIQSANVTAPPSGGIIQLQEDSPASVGTITCTVNGGTTPIITFINNNIKTDSQIFVNIVGDPLVTFRVLEQSASNFRLKLINHDSQNAYTVKVHYLIIN